MFAKVAVWTARRHWRQPTWLLAFALCLLTLSGNFSLHPAALPVHPLLLQLAMNHPEEMVTVIVQKTEHNSQVEARTATLGGAVTNDLWIVNGFEANVPAKAVPQLAAAGGVRWISPNAGVQEAAGPADVISTAKLVNTYIKTIGADQVWNAAPSYLQGQGVGVAVLDSGIQKNDDFGSRVVQVAANAYGESFDDLEKDNNDNYGHGTHVAGIIGGDGRKSTGMYIGVAPKVNLYALKIADRNGQGTATGVLLATQWLLLNHVRYNIRVINMSFSSAIWQSYNVDPVDAAVEALWFNGMVVVVAAGNNGPNSLITSPANDPFAIAVGAADDRGTASPADDSMAVFSSSGNIENGSSKPDIVAPGRHIISVLSKDDATVAGKHSPNIVASNHNYFMMSGTSMASPVVAGAVALLVQSHPTLTPTQIKGCLLANARAPLAGSQAKYLTVQNIAAWNCSGATANLNIKPSNLFLIALQQLTAAGLNLGTSGDVNWGNVNWGNVNWGNVNWGNVNWGNVNWGNVNWGNVNWGNVNWGNVAWD